MKATYFMGHETFEVRECPIPKAKPGTVVVKNYACGVCGTDVHIYHGEKGSAAVNPPVVLGHEYSGVVTEVGEGVKGLKIGDHVTIDPNIYCGECEYCRNGKKQMCRHMEAVGVTMNGGFEEYSIVPAAQALLLNPNVPLEYGAMSEPLACCLHGIDRAEIKVGNIVCVVGGGAIGLLLVQLALNVFGSLDLLPFTGVTFPFVSRGGTSLISCWMLMAFIKSSDTRRNASFAVRPGRGKDDEEEGNTPASDNGFAPEDDPANWEVWQPCEK